jgi:hypothetical protein
MSYCEQLRNLSKHVANNVVRPRGDGSNEGQEAVLAKQMPSASGRASRPSPTKVFLHETHLGADMTRESGKRGHATFWGKHKGRANSPQNTLGELFPQASTVWTGAPKPPPACWMAWARMLLASHSLHASAQPSYLHRGSHTFKTCTTHLPQTNLAAHDALPTDAVACAYS